MPRIVSLVAHWFCNLACSSYFLAAAYNQSRILKSRVGPTEALVLVPCILLAILIITRPPAREYSATPIVMLVVLYSKCYYLLLDLSKGADYDQLIVGFLVTTLGTAFWAVSILALGRSFSILPAMRQIRTKGPYSVVRHPIYVSYVVVDIGLLISFPNLGNALVLIGATTSYVIRALMEETFLREHPDYSNYSKKTKYRFVPFIY